MVFVDEMKAEFGRMKMSHMVASTEEELHNMAAHIGVARRWSQYEGTYRSHYDICQSKRKLALDAGAIVITRRELGAMLTMRRYTGHLGTPADAIAWARARINPVDAAARKGGSV